MRKFLHIGIAIIVFVSYLIFSYNNLKGHSYLYEPFYISIKSDLPENVRLNITYLTENDPVTSQDAHLESNDMLDSNQYIFKIDSSYRLKSFRLFFLSLPEEEEFTIKEIKAFNKKGGEFNFSLKSKDLVRTDNLSLSNLISNELCIRKVSKNITTTPSLYFDMSDSFDGLFIKSDKRALEIPSFPASIIILLLGILMAYTIYPTIFSLKLKGVNPGAYFLALALLILPTGEKATNLLLSIAIVTGIIFSLRESTLLCKIRDNRLLLAVSVFTVAIYTIAFLLSARDGQSANIYKIKMGIPLTLFALCVNINTKSEIRLQHSIEDETPIIFD